MTIGAYERAYVNKLLSEAEAGYADAQFKLGEMYYEGLSVPQDGAEAVKWWRLAAEQGDADAQYGLKYLMNYKKQKINILSELDDLKTAHDAVVDAAYGEWSSPFADAIWLYDEKKLNDAKIAFSAACDALEAELKTLTGEDTKSDFHAVHDALKAERDTIMHNWRNELKTLTGEYR